MQTQRELELDMVKIGKDYADRIYQEAEEKGRASSNPYASAIHRRFVEPLSKLLSARYIGTEKKRGPVPQVVKLIRGLDPLVTSYVAVRSMMNHVIPEPDCKGTNLCSVVGTSVYSEALLRSFEDINPSLFHALTKDLARKMSKSERHRINVFKHEAKHHKINLIEWTRADRVLVGKAIIREMVEIELLTERTVAQNGQSVLLYDLHPSVRKLLDNIKDFVSVTQPMKMPCVEPPKPWVSANDGGWHTDEMRRVSPTCFTAESFVPDGDVPDRVLDTLNRLQSVKWRINRKLLTAVRNVSRHFDVGEVMSQADLPRPPKPIWLVDGITKEDMNEWQKAEFRDWRRSVADWHTEKQTNHTKWGRFYEAMRVATRYESLDELWFVWQMDYRGRCYAQSRGVSPQGSDLQKALIEFGTGKLISKDADSVRWFKINGANRYGHDSVELDERVAWVDEHKRNILDMARDPISFRDWTQADKPFQFLAWCFEYADWVAFPDVATTRLAVGLDGTCNGLQHFSAMTRDEVGGEATNLTPGKRRDIYGLVALVLTDLLRNEDCTDGWRDEWLRHGITRKLTKRSVMTLPYGSTRFSCADFIQKDYMQLGLSPEFAREDYNKAATWLSFRLWGAIGKVVVRGQEAMAWLQRAARAVIEQGHDEITWRTPMGLKVRQRYAAHELLRLTSRLHGSVRVKLTLREANEDKVDGRRHLQGIAPNFIHSLDGAHMQMVIEECGKVGIDALAMIHDDYGTTCDRTQELYDIIRRTFVEMYQANDPLVEFAQRYCLPEPDIRGSLDITQVIDSEHFFS